MNNDSDVCVLHVHFLPLISSKLESSFPQDIIRTLGIHKVQVSQYNGEPQCDPHTVHPVAVFKLMTFRYCTQIHLPVRLYCFPVNSVAVAARWYHNN